MNLTWKLVILLLSILGGVAYLGTAHVLNGEYVAAIYSAIAAGVLTGHFALTVPKGGTTNNGS